MTSSARSRKSAEEISNIGSDDEAPIFLPLEETTNGDYTGNKDKTSKLHHQQRHSNAPSAAASLLSNIRMAVSPQPSKPSSASRERCSSYEVTPAQVAGGMSSSSHTSPSAGPLPTATKPETSQRVVPSNDTASNNSGLTISYWNQLVNDTNMKDVVNSAMSKLKDIDAKKIISITMLSLITLLICDTLFSSPENRIFKPDFSEKFLLWVQEHPAKGVIWILLFMSVAVIFMVPIGTPITVGCGYIYKGAYGWKLGVTIATIISTAGSALGAVTCFLLGRYLMRNQVRKWIKKYPLFDAIDAASAEHGLRIMAMLYLTPILPLGPISYMCGTTSMTLSSFVIAKVAALPLMILYVFIGASTGALIGKDSAKTAEEVKKIEENETLIISGILLSFVMIAFITHYIKKELNTILERQQKHKPGENDFTSQHGDVSASGVGDEEGNGVEMQSNMTAPRQRKH